MEDNFIKFLKEQAENTKLRMKMLDITDKPKEESTMYEMATRLIIKGGLLGEIKAINRIMDDYVVLLKKEMENG